MNKPQVLDVEKQQEAAVPAVKSQSQWWDQSLPRPTCANCGEARVGAFCPACGQKQLSERLKFGDLIRSLLSRLTAIEAGLFHTFWSLCWRPGGVARDYVSGKQRPYVNPLTYFFLAATAQVLAFWSVKGFLTKELSAQFEQQLKQQGPPPEGNSRLEELLGMPLQEALVESYLSGVSQGYSYAALIFFAIPFAGLLWLLHRWRGEMFRLGETIVFSLFVFSQILFLAAVLTPFSVRLDTWVHMSIMLSIYVGVSQLAHGEFFARTWTARLLTLMSMVIAWVPFVCSIIGFFLFAFLLKVVWAVMASP
ncbi:DUF3667 domain-containing protein [Planctomycetaceae bacterium SH139]